ncbi:hypothetical protein FOMPIDRAFT_1044812 [Fomitopsis schrenkii]|uniref:Jacalin-type lectin domain-containing protein n=1 Tax=Fomitopsis schrenkii TaxID=2126942 RepID=S8EMT5_FOMSC|nr:hypothetical protein FOMPIDRAFT_1044812 [Fomitopsis schrenkii]
MNSYIATTVVGDANGQLINDMDRLTNKQGQLIIDERKAIRQIMVRHNGSPVSDSVIFGLNVWYKLKDSSELLEIRHGYQAAPISPVSLGDAEVLVGIFGRAGYQTSSTEHKVIGSIGFTIYNTETATVRTEGPFGVGAHENSGQWEPFYVSDVMALGAYALDTEAPLLTGLIFYKPILSA